MKTQLALVMVALALQAPVARAADPPLQEQIKLLQQQVLALQQQLATLNSVVRVGANGAVSLTGGADMSVQVKRLFLLAGDEIVLKTGSASITLRKNGEITILGTTVDVKGSADVVIKGAKINSN